MIRTITDYYTHEFNIDEGITVALFTTKTDTKYRVYFYPVKDYFDTIPEDSIISTHGFYFGFTKVEPNENKLEPIDFKVMNTIVNIVNEFFEVSVGEKILLLFHCSDEGGKTSKIKRSKRFNDCFLDCNTKNKFEKFNEELFVPHEIDGQIHPLDKEYLSIIIESDNADKDLVLEEFQELKNKLIAGK